MYSSQLLKVENVDHFLIFHSNFFRYIWAGLLVVLGIYLNVYSKRNKLTTQELIAKIADLAHLPKKLRHIFEGHQKDAMFEV